MISLFTYVKLYIYIYIYHIYGICIISRIFKKLYHYFRHLKYFSLKKKKNKLKN